jgi:hypothetical protein
MDTVIAAHFVFLLSLFPALLAFGVMLYLAVRSRWGRARLIWLAAWGGRATRKLGGFAGRVPGLRRVVAWRVRRAMPLSQGDRVRIYGKGYRVRKVTKKDTVVRREYTTVQIPWEQIRREGPNAVVPVILSRIRKDYYLRRNGTGLVKRTVVQGA